MTRPTAHPRLRRALAAFTACAAAGLAACNTDALLNAPDPDVVPPGAIDASTSAALTLKAGVGFRFAQATSGSNGDTDNTFLFGGLLADEWRSSDTFEQRNTTDQRVLVEQNTFLTGQYRGLNRVRTEGEAAIRSLRGVLPTPAPAFNAGEVFGWQALVLNLIGEHYCNGVILSDLDETGLEVFGDRITVDSVFRLAAARGDSGLASIAGGTAADSARVRNLAAVTKGRALLNRGDFAGAAAAVAAVPTTFRYFVRHSLNSQSNQLWALNVNVTRYSMSEREGGNGLPFRSAADPRIPSTAPANRLGFDSFTPWIGQTKWGRTDSVMVASGIEARLIESEAQLRAGAATWLTTLNNPRVQANGGVAGLAALADPGTAATRLDLVMRERAFWMFSTGHRLGDLRRLVRQYGRAQAQVFPSGTYPKGGNYGDAMNFPLPLVEQNNPKFQQGCIDRNA